MAGSEGRPLVEAVEQKEDLYEEQEPSGCEYGCFRGFGWCRGGREEEDKKGDSWVSCKLRNIKEFTEVIAGPKWKTFIRKLSGYGKKQQKNRFQYDEHSYALNFNSGAQSEDDDMPPTFSARFTAPFPSARRQTEQ
ncbi:uncharacterized protein LOC106760094 [Vigna radiata var. radiata]|uniref:Uncharacterized protein LOC106760094 n=1 Tax=Vigna radiata var. radiata TaxID=3916 RepID=A0A1S3TZ20_VIGRR|nr:uncharacterized protein LOC106760094 [Vigna radiata var. radiata]XP_022636213.1 uncharacterized protein LOC106760094 [Vigna radiata var. radiata]XP_022636214.1 uncharacterized protein LOC106760094 [Vigna radiata var. radiata]